MLRSRSKAFADAVWNVPINCISGTCIVVLLHDETGMQYFLQNKYENEKNIQIIGHMNRMHAAAFAFLSRLLNKK